MLLRILESARESDPLADSCLGMTLASSYIASGAQKGASQVLFGLPGRTRRDCLGDAAIVLGPKEYQFTFSCLYLHAFSTFFGTLCCHYSLGGHHPPSFVYPYNFHPGPLARRSWPWSNPPSRLRPFTLTPAQPHRYQYSSKRDPNSL